MTLEEPVMARGFQYKHGDRPLDGFTIQRAAGRGGFGEVYQAVSDSGREVALKLVHTYEQIELRGISQCMNLKSPHLVTIFDVKYGEDGRPWVIMEFVSGPSLRELLDAAPSGLGVAKAAFFLREIGKGLTYLHDCGIVHRDLKPGNIFYENGYVKIGDYGLSKAMSLTRHSGQTVAVGTLHYMAPEIGEGRYDRSIDIYAMGALLFEMLTGQVPFFGSSPAEVLMKHLTADVNLDGIEEPLKSVIRKAMAKNPADRYQSVQEMVEAVYGSDEIRNSVTQFSPESLTMVAGRIAGNVGSSGNRPAEDWRMRGEQRKQKMRRWGKKWWKSKDDLFGDASAAPDPIAWPGRIFLAVAAAGLAAFIVASLADQSFAADEACWTFLSIMGAAVGAMLSWRFISPGLAGESTWFQRFAIGAPAALAAMLLSAPAWADPLHPRNEGNLMLASFIGLLVLDWKKRLSPFRKDRLSLSLAITAAIAVLILCGMFNLGDQQSPMVFATVIGASVATGLCAPKSPRRLKSKPSEQTAAPFPSPGPTPSPMAMPPIPPIPPIPPVPPILPASFRSPFDGAFGQRRTGEKNRTVWVIAMVVMAMFFLGIFPFRITGGGIFPMRVFGISAFMPIVLILVVFSLFRRNKESSTRESFGAGQPISQFSSSGAAVALGIGRWLLSLIGTVLLWASLILAFSWLVNLPGVIVAIQRHQPYVAEGSFLDAAAGSHWPNIVRSLAAFAACVLGFVSVIVLMLARRSRGALHMMRALIGAGLLFCGSVCIRRFIAELVEFSDFTSFRRVDCGISSEDRFSQGNRGGGDLCAGHDGNYVAPKKAEFCCYSTEYTHE